MDTVKVSKDELLVKLRENREQHINTYEQVMEAYYAKAVKLLEEHISRIREGAVEQVSVILPAPQNYEEEYNRAIEMMEWSQDDIIELYPQDFDRFVRDQWAWKREFTKMSQTYTG